MKTASTACTVGSSKASWSASAISPIEASWGNECGSRATCSPHPMHASAASAASEVELPTTATPRPAGRGWWSTSWAMLNIWCRLDTRMMPLWRSMASSASGCARLRRMRCPGGTP